MKKCSPYLNNALTPPCKNEPHISYCYKALLEYYPLHQAWCETQSSSSTKKTNWQSHSMFKMSITGMKCTSTRACWPLVNCVNNQWLLQASPHMQQMLLQLTNDWTHTHVAERQPRCRHAKTHASCMRLMHFRSTHAFPQVISLIFSTQLRIIFTPDFFKNR